MGASDRLGKQTQTMDDSHASEDLPVEASLTSRPQVADNGERETSGPIEAASSHGHCCRENSNG